MPVKVLNEGGPGSGNFGHEGRPGVAGGSGPGGRVDIDKLTVGKNLRYDDLLKGGKEQSNKIRSETSKMSSADIHTDIKSLGIEGNMTALPENVQQEIYAGILHSYAPYENAPKLKDIELREFKGGQEKFIAAMRRNEDGSRTLIVNPKRIGNKEQMAYNVEAGWHPKGSDTTKSMIDHEFGHTLNDKPSGRYQLLKEQKHPGAKQKFITKEISGGAAINSRELVAESWSMRQNGTESPLAHQVNQETLKRQKVQAKKAVSDQPSPKPEAPKKTLLERVEEEMNRPRTLLERVEEKIKRGGGL